MNKIKYQHSGSSVTSRVSVDIRDTFEWTALMRACSCGRPDVVEFLLERGANPNHHTELITPLMVCCTSTYIPESIKLNCVRILLQYNAQINATDKYKKTSLMYAVESGYKTIVDELLSVPTININAQDKDGFSALFFAISNFDLEIAQKLIDSGIKLDLVNRYDKTALDFALLKQCESIAKLLGFTETKVEDNKVKTHDLFDIFNELPLPSGKEGFKSEVKSIINCLPHLESSEFTFGLYEFLTATEKDLQKAGVLFDYDRKCKDAINILGNFTKHLTIINATLEYLKCRISSRKKIGNLNMEHELLSVLTDIFCTVKNLNKNLVEIVDHSKQLKISFPGDYIRRRSKNVRIYFMLHILSGT
ncbi:ankyrin repeat, SAM and basic leucine zipper domain-containing protein, putative [Pediculus humanus corporis]|uniref:Ankyrin repeat, SAM and basic leucine zipper domain-containing protein, putative n=1 Tax=Pediculus humanus subsp. corporis TaxID=121224 RepID=E0VMT6_PEDHC|nr:ankyrin repeat, SAM and basic leucine zipper domain-containing protein, putative [Pediculus humanus corporis]EEB14692.1 ankyrin repeat, SAM and basic leucine zipper domain-containing protein, putative [Pediculus humanus corporis]